MTTLSPSGLLRIGAAELEYRVIGAAPSDAPTIVMLHEGLGSAALWGDFPEHLQAATGANIFVYSRAGYGASTSVPLPRPLDYMSTEALEVLPVVLDRIGFRRGLLLGHSDGASIAASTTRSMAGTTPGSTRSSVAGIFPTISPISAFPWPSCRGPTISMGQFAKSRSRRRSAIVRSKSR